MKTFNKALLTLIFLFLCFLAPATTSAQSPPAPQTVEELTSLLKSEMEKQHIAGMMLTIVSKDSTLFAGGLGYAEVAKKSPVTEKHLFRQASLTKLFTALGILTLVEQGKLSLDTKLKAIAPEVPFQNAWEDTHPITVTHLMEHSTGFDDKTPFEEYNHSGKALSSLEALEVFAKFMKAKWKPGERYSYSNVNYAVLTYLIEKFSGDTFQNYMRTNVFSPLGMPYAHIHLSGDGSDAYSKGYVWRKNQFIVVPHRPQYSAGNGSLNANAIDLAHALQVYLRNWHTPQGQFLSLQMLEDSETPHTYLSARAGMKDNYALGNQNLTLHGINFRGHSGGIGGYLSQFLYSRELGLGFAFTINTYNESFHGYATDLIARFISQHQVRPAKPKAFPVNEKAIRSYLGYYRLANSNHSLTAHFGGLKNTIKLQQSGGKLAASFLLGGAMIWEATDESSRRFRNEFAHHPHILFTKDSEGSKVIADKTIYLQKITALQAWGPILLLFLSLIALASSLMAGLVGMVLYFARRNTLATMLLLVSPAASAQALLLVVWVSHSLIEATRAAAPISSLSMLWHLGSYGFALLVLCTLLLLVRQWSYLRSKWLKGYIAYVALSSCYLLGLFVLSGWYEL